ncbi:FAD-binding domain-containing protein [Infundibulicybe gibba]|nr:FAD-binding domain-containing protein [Infundibulicybe gibba]
MSRHIFSLPILILLSSLGLVDAHNSSVPRCRNVPGAAGFPSTVEWAALNASVAGRLVAVVPTVKFCSSLPGGCTPQQFASSTFLDEIPGAMKQINWEQDYDSVPPSLCLHNSTTCGQGNVPLFAVLAESASDIQKGVDFARANNLRLAVKASGHDYLGRSTAKNSLLISTHKLQSIQFTDDFRVGGDSKGSTVTVGSGVGLDTLYKAARVKGKIVVGGTSATVAAAGGYVQGGGHSSLSPTFGLAADNTLEFTVVLADGSVVTANEVEHADLFWAMRGGGAGSWGVIVSATFQTFPTFNASVSTGFIFSNSSQVMGQVASAHARHIFDWDPFRVGQYFFLAIPDLLQIPDSPGKFVMMVQTFFPNVTVDIATAALQPFFDEATAAGALVTVETIESNINDVLISGDDSVGVNMVMGSRFVPATAYKNSPTTFGDVYTQLLDGGAKGIVGSLVAGGKVAENANIPNAVHPGWRSAKVHLTLVNAWDDSASIDQVHGNETFFMDTQLPLLEKLSGTDAGAYSNEADVLEKNFQDTFFGPNYARLSAIKSKYDPLDLFIVGAGVGSERWDKSGMCKI